MAELEVLPQTGPLSVAVPRHRRRLPRGLPLISLGLSAVIVVAALGGELIAPYDPNGLDLGAAFRPPACSLEDRRSICSAPTISAVISSAASLPAPASR